MRDLKLPPFAVDMRMRRRVDSISELVFPSAAGTPRWPANVRRQWRQALQSTPYEGITPRDFRKAVATLLEAEQGIRAAQEQLGHASEAVTRRHYVPMVNEGPDATAILEESFGKTASK
ncbi:tyrosine-type recombinase/integrase [Leifsonia sp. NPDC077715]|uniref:tyrosine-type recombinase/integrase n=1 Tax=Leifsonia sp. NPDC077715 TaxID=3155539 RepID=UPI0034321248